MKFVKLFFFVQLFQYFHFKIKHKSKLKLRKHIQTKIKQKFDRKLKRKRNQPFIYNKEKFISLKAQEYKDGENDPFDRSVHTNKSINYFKLIAQISNPKNRLKEITEFLHSWFRIDDNHEHLFVKYLKQKNRKVKNRFKVQYSNKKTNLTKYYYIDIDYLDNYDNQKPYEQNQVVNVYNIGEDPYYKKNYKYTLQKECEAIQMFMSNPFQINCYPIVNKHGYVVPNVYKAKMQYRDEDEIIKHNEVFVVESFDQKDPKSQEADISGQSESQKQITEALRDKIGDLDSTMVSYFNNNVNLEYIQQVIADIEQKILIKNKLPASEAEEIEHQYQEALKQKLWMDYKHLNYTSVEFDKTYEIMVDKVEEINGFNIEYSMKRTIFELSQDQQEREHEINKQLYTKEFQIHNLIDRLDELFYKIETKIDKNYHKYTQ